MKRAIIICVILSLLTLGLGGCAPAGTPAAPAPLASRQATPTPAPTPDPTPAPTTAPKQVTPRVFTFTINSAAIAKNLIGDNPSRTSYVLLPKGYAADSRRYPVVYFFNGFGDTPGSFAYSQGLALDKAVPAGQEFIVVDVDMRNANGGSFGVNSPVTGN